MKIQEGIEFFEPDDTFIKWLVEHAAGRFIVDVGCGTGHITQKLTNAGAKAFGIDPYFDPARAIEINNEQRLLGKPTINFLPMEVESCGRLLNGMCTATGPGIMLLFARPCHLSNSFVEAGIDLLPAGVESLYITAPMNLEEFDDLGKYTSKIQMLDHRGCSTDYECVYSVVK